MTEDDAPRWRTVFTGTERRTGVAPVCPQQNQGASPSNQIDSGSIQPNPENV